jgi:formyltetrahydrofolate-dependent phosphoribosylglycinamide formyltransferase
LQNLIDRISGGSLPATIVGVASSRADAFGLERAKRAGLPTAIVTPSPRPTFHERLWEVVSAWRPDWVVCAGWMHLLTVPDAFRWRVLNVHPSLLPAFGGKGMYGRHVHEAVLEYGAKVSGCTVHFVDGTYDTGPVVLQRTVPVLDADTPDTLAARVQEAEREAYPEAIRRLTGGGWKLEGRKVVFGV